MSPKQALIIVTSFFIVCGGLALGLGVVRMLGEVGQWVVEGLQ